VAESFPVELLQTLVTSKQPVDPAALTFQPIPTGKHNTSYFVGTGDGELVLRIAPPDDAGFLFYERRMIGNGPPSPWPASWPTMTPAPSLTAITC
jgi:aminoglycoside phosphotransferase (APT) family kinase protein